MKEELLTFVKDANSAVDDLRGLINLRDHSVLDRICLHLESIKDAYICTSNTEEECSEVKSHLLNILTDEVINIVNNRPFISDSYFVNKRPSLNALNRFIPIKNTISRLFEIFDFKGQVGFRFNRDSFTISGPIEPEGINTQKRVIAYHATRKCFENKVLLTYRLNQDSNDQVNIELTFDLSFNTNKVLSFSGQHKRLKLGLPNNFYKYRISNNVFERQIHHILKFNSDLTFQMHEDSIEELIKEDPAKWSLIHLSFLFRPVSIIIPNEVNMLTLEEFQRVNGHAGRTGKTPSYFLDLFSLLNK